MTNVTIGSQKLTRDQLSKILPDLRSIRFFEQLISDLQSAASGINDRNSVNVWTKNQSTAQVDLTDAPVVALDASQSNGFRLLISSAVGLTRKLANPTNATAGMMLAFEFVQPAAGGCALTFDTLYDFGPQGTPSLASAPGARDLMLAYFDGAKMACLFRSAGGISTSVVTLTDASAISFTAADSTIFQLLTTSTVGATRLIVNPTGTKPGQTWNMDVQQPSSGGPCKLTFGSAFVWGRGGGDAAPIGSVTPNSIDTYGFEVRSDLSIIGVMIGQSGPAGPAGAAGSAGAAGAAGAAGPAGSGNGVNIQTGTTYTYLTTDASKLVSRSNAASLADTLPQATGGFASPFVMDVENTGAGTLVITPTTSTIDGATTLTLKSNQGCRVYADSTGNYKTQRGVGGGSSGSLARFRAYASANSAPNSNPAAPYNQVQIDTVVFDSGGYFNTTTHRFIPPAGTWALFAQIATQGCGNVICAISKNSVIDMDGTYGPGDGTYTKHSCAVVVQANGTDYFESRAYTGNAGTLLSGSSVTVFQGYQVA